MAMSGARGRTLCLLLFVGAVIAQEQQQDPVDEAPTSSAPESAVPPTDRICRVCECSAGQLDCRDRPLEAPFTAADWAGLPNKDNITEIDLSGTELYNVTAFPELVKLEVLNLSRCSIRNIEDLAFRDLQQLRVLDLSHNDLTSANLQPNAFQGRYSPVEYEPLEELRILDLSHNDLHSLNKDLFEHTPDLTQLRLDYNPFILMDHSTVIAISGLPKLQILSMRGCELTEIPERFLHTPRELEHLDLSDNMLKAVPQELEEARNLLFLSLNQNPIKRIDAASEEFPGFPPLSWLKELHLCDMDELEYIGAYALGPLARLETLHLSNNARLAELAPKALARADDAGDAFVWPPIKKLYISNNNLTALDSRLVSRWDQLAALDAAGNPYLCDCTTQWMVDVLTPIADILQPNASASFVCASPVEMFGKTMQQLNEKKSTMRCLDKYNHHPERDGALLLGTLIGVLLAVPVALTLLLLWRRGYFAPCGAVGPAGFSRAFYVRAETEDLHI